MSCSISGIDGAPRYCNATEATSGCPCQAATRATPPRKRMDCVFTAGERTPCPGPLRGRAGRAAPASRAVRAPDFPTRRAGLRLSRGALVPIHRGSFLTTVPTPEVRRVLDLDQLLGYAAERGA